MHVYPVHTASCCLVDQSAHSFMEDSCRASSFQPSDISVWKGNLSL